MTTTTHTADAIQIRTASARDVGRLASTLGRALFDDPVFRWAIPDDERRREGLPGVFAIFAEAFEQLGDAYLAADAGGAALWAPPGQGSLDEESNVRLAEETAADERFLELAELLGERHPAGSYYYLQFLGVEPERQGRGIGSAMLEHVLERCDREGIRAYLDATSPRNKRLYERHGFRAGDEFAPAGGPPLWPMWREPKPGGGALRSA